MKKFLMQGAALAAIVMPAVVALPTAAYAQETTSTISGNVTSKGAPIAGAKLTLTHVPTGTVATATTNADGSFSASGLRPGGPYTVEVKAAGYDDFQATDINTAVGQVFQLPIGLESTGQPIVVTATRIRGAGNVSQGPATVLTAADISKIASVNRDIRDLAERDPFATLDTGQSTGRQVSFAGVNPRFNRFTIDGVPVTDSFGLNPDALPSRRGPVPLDSIAQFETKVAPYDIREGFFLGGVSNAILKSGSNRFHGTGFYTYSSNKLQGNQSKPYPVPGGITDPNGFITVPPYKSRDFGATLSGPIIPDRIFFMVSGERVRASLPYPYGTVETNGGAPVASLHDVDFNNIVSIAKSKYGVDAGGILRQNGDKDDRLVGRLDFNISSAQRLALTGIYTKDSILTPGTTSSSSLATLSDDYVKPNRVVAGVAQLNSEWSSNFSTEARVLYKDYQSGQTPILANTAMATVCTDAVSAGSATSCTLGIPSVIVGPQGSSQANSLHVKTWEASFVARTTFGNHSVRLLADMQNSNNYDLFVNGVNGVYYFDSIADFQAGKAGTVSYGNATTGNPNDASAVFTYQTYTFGVQDDWKVNPDLTVSVGVRYDLFGSNDRPLNNVNFLAREGYSNRSMVSGRGLLQPRFGFNYKVTPRISIRGGGGIFGGGTPDVYIANSFSTSGVQPVTVNQNQCAAALTNVSLTIPPAACVAAISNASLASGTSVAALAPNFKIPSLYRATLSATWRPDLGPLGDNWQLGADILYSHAKDAIRIYDGRDRPITGANALTPDGRQRYYDIVCNNNTTACSDINSDYILGNTHNGQSWVMTARVEKKWNFGLDVWGAFSYQNVKDQQSMTSSQASSIYANSAFLDPNGGGYGHSNDEVRYSFRYDVSFDHAFFGDYKTKIDLFGQTRIGSPYSYTMQDLSCCGATRGTVFGVSGTASAAFRNLFYVPTGPNDPKAQYADALTQTLLENLINTTKLAKYRGQIAPRNAFNSKWFTKIDLHLEQEIPTFIGHSRISVFADAENVLNLINHNWGQTLRSVFNYTKSITQVTCKTVGTNTCGQYVYTTTQTNYNNNVYDQFVNFNPGTSLYVIRVGARVTF